MAQMSVELYRRDLTVTWEDTQLIHLVTKQLYHSTVYSLPQDQALNVLSVRIGLFLAANHIMVFALGATSDDDLCKKLKQWKRQPQVWKCYKVLDFSK